jgi:hypothetical protein
MDELRCANQFSVSNPYYSRFRVCSVRPERQRFGCPMFYVSRYGASGISGVEEQKTCFVTLGTRKKLWISLFEYDILTPGYPFAEQIKDASFGRKTAPHVRHKIGEAKDLAILFNMKPGEQKRKKRNRTYTGAKTDQNLTQKQ